MKCATLQIFCILRHLGWLIERIILELKGYLDLLHFGAKCNRMRVGRA